MTRNILICNDDGYLAKGLATLVEAAEAFGRVRVIAPEANRSGAAHSLTLNRPLAIHQAENGFYYVEGTPADCIHLALNTMHDFRPDIVFSGINHGANMGDDVLYSGTVAAAAEAHLAGLPALSFSLNSKRHDFVWDEAKSMATSFLARFFSYDLPRKLLWNVNFPDCKANEVKGLKEVKLGRRYYGQNVVETKSPRGEKLYWIGPAGAPRLTIEGSDFVFNASRHITVTPLMLDLTARESLGVLREFCAPNQDFSIA